VTTTKLDVANRDAVYAWADQVVRDHGQVNLIFNNAGVALTVNLEHIKVQDFEWIMGINFWGVVYGSQAFLPHLKASGDGHIINTSSLFGLISIPTQGAYNSTKFAVRGYTEALRMELELEGACVSATCVHPGGIATNIAMAGKVDPVMEKITGATIEAQKRRANKLINTTTAESAALQILSAVENNERRVLVGPDAKFLDKVVRLLGSAYQVLVLRQVRSMNKKSAAKSARSAA
jgi:short-subunit dehydrogenase